MREFFSRLSAIGSAIFNIAIVCCVLILGACAAIANTSPMRTVSIEMVPSTNPIDTAYIRILQDAGYRIVEGTALARAEIRYQTHTTRCEGRVGVYARARLIVRRGNRELDISSTIPCAYDSIAGQIELQDMVERDRQTYIRRIREFD